RRDRQDRHPPAATAQLHRRDRRRPGGGQVSQIDELIAEHCPDGVEQRALGEVGEFIRGSGIQKKDLRAEGVPAVHYGQIHTAYGIWTKETISYVDPV